MTVASRGNANSSTRSAGRPVGNRSSSSAAIARMRSSSDATRRGVNAPLDAAACAAEGPALLGGREERCARLLPGARDLRVVVRLPHVRHCLLAREGEFVRGHPLCRLRQAQPVAALEPSNNVHSKRSPASHCARSPWRHGRRAWDRDALGNHCPRRVDRFSSP